MSRLLTVDLHTVGMYNQKSFPDFPKINKYIEDVLVHMCRIGFPYYSMAGEMKWRITDPEYRNEYFAGRMPNQDEVRFIVNRVQDKILRKLSKHFGNVYAVSYDVKADKLFISVN